MACGEGGLKWAICCKGGAQFLLTFWITYSARERIFICICTKVSVLKVRMNVAIKLSATTSIKVKDTSFWCYGNVAVSLKYALVA